MSLFFVVLLLAFFMIFMGKWNRRARVMTLAEWMEYRFGTGRQGQAARIFAAVANLAFAIATVTYFAQGGGIFLGEILGMDADLAAVLMILIASTYTIASGLGDYQFLVDFLTQKEAPSRVLLLGFRR